MFNSFPIPKPDKGGGSNIKSIQRGTAGISGSNSTAVSISAVDLTKSIVKISIFSVNDNASMGLVLASFTNATTLNLATFASPTSGISVSWEVIEFNNVKSLQSGVSALGTTAISSINMAMSMMFFSYSSTSTGATLSYGGVKGTIASSTSLSFSAPNAVTYNIQWYIVEFY